MGEHKLKVMPEPLQRLPVVLPREYAFLAARSSLAGEHIIVGVHHAAAEDGPLPSEPTSVVDVHLLLPPTEDHPPRAGTTCNSTTTRTSPVSPRSIYSKTTITLPGTATALALLPDVFPVVVVVVGFATGDLVFLAKQAEQELLPREVEDHEDHVVEQELLSTTAASSTSGGGRRRGEETTLREFLRVRPSSVGASPSSPAAPVVPPVSFTGFERVGGAHLHAAAAVVAGDRAVEAFMRQPFGRRKQSEGASAQDLASPFEEDLASVRGGAAAPRINGAADAFVWFRTGEGGRCCLHGVGFEEIMEWWRKEESVTVARREDKTGGRAEAVRSPGFSGTLPTASVLASARVFELQSIGSSGGEKRSSAASARKTGADLRSISAKDRSLRSIGAKDRSHQLVLLLCGKAPYLHALDLPPVVLSGGRARSWSSLEISALPTRQRFEDPERRGLSTALSPDSFLLAVVDDRGRVGVHATLDLTLLQVWNREDGGAGLRVAFALETVLGIQAGAKLELWDTRNKVKRRWSWRCGVGAFWEQVVCCAAI